MVLGFNTTARHCGYTAQFKGLEGLHPKYKARGLAVVGFASDDFKQGAKDEAEAADVWHANYGVTFGMPSPSPVEGRAANPVFQELDRHSGDPNWSLNKYLVSACGKVVRRFDSRTSPESAERQPALEQLQR